MKATKPSKLANLTSPSFALLSPSGWGNLGDAAIVDAVIEQIRLRFPDARIVALTLNPSDTVHRHGVDAVTLRGFSSRGYGIQEPNRTVGQSAPNLAVGGTPVVNASQTPAGRNGLIRFLDFATRPLRRPLYPLRSEIRHIRNSIELLKSIDMLVVCGGGQLDDYWGGTWGHPYVLYRWGKLARRAGAEIVVLGVGTGTLQTSLSRLFVRRFLANANFRSFRDTGSRDLVGAPDITKDDTVGPDLAFALDVEPYLRQPRPETDKLHIAVSPMAWLDPRIWPEKDQSAYDNYVTLMADFVASLSSNRRHVSLFATDGSDEHAITDVLAVMGKKFPSEAGMVDRPAIGSVEHLLNLFTQVDLVVASRLHGVLLSCLMHVPTVALSYDRKVVAVMNDLKLPDYCGDLADIELKRLINLTDKALANREAITGILREQVAENRRKLDAQFDRVLGPVLVQKKVRA